MYIEGVVTNITSKSVTLKNGPRAGKSVPVYSMMVDGKEIELGFKKPTTEEGELFRGSVSDSPNRFGKYELETPNGSTVKSLPSTTTHSTRAWSFPIPKDDHATSICRQSALKAAVDILTNTGFYAGAKKADDVVVVTLNMASKLATWTTGQTEVEEAERILAGTTHEPTA